MSETILSSKPLFSKNKSSGWGGGVTDPQHVFAGGVEKSMLAPLSATRACNNSCSVGCWEDFCVIYKLVPQITWGVWVSMAQLNWKRKSEFVRRWRRLRTSAQKNVTGTIVLFFYTISNWEQGTLDHSHVALPKNELWSVIMFRWFANVVLLCMTYE